MNSKILLLSLGVMAFTSCSTAYKAGQTPDDVYYSPAKQQEAYVTTESQGDRYRNYDDYGNTNQYYNSYRDDRFLRLRIANRARWSDFDYYAMMDNYGRYNYSLFSPWNSYYYWNSFYNPYSPYSHFNYYPGYYNPYYGGGIFTNPKTPVSISRPRTITPGSYANRTYNPNNLYMDRNLGTNSNAYNHPGTTTNGIMNNQRNNKTRYNNSNSIFRSNNSNNTNTYRSTDTYRNSNSNNTYTPSRSSDAPVRSYTPSSSSSSSSSSSGSSGGGSARPSRGN